MTIKPHHSNYAGASEKTPELTAKDKPFKPSKSICLAHYFIIVVYRALPIPL
jgi:hypothetical protein